MSSEKTQPGPVKQTLEEAVASVVALMDDDLVAAAIRAKLEIPVKFEPRELARPVSRIAKTQVKSVRSTASARESRNVATPSVPEEALEASDSRTDHAPAKQALDLLIEQVGNDPDWLSWYEPFLMQLREFPNVRAACQRGQVTRSVAYEHKSKNPKFRKAWTVAVEDGRDAIRHAIVDRAVNGKSDRMLELMARLWLPEYDVKKTGQAVDPFDEPSAAERALDDDGSVVVYLPDNGRDPKPDPSAN